MVRIELFIKGFLYQTENINVPSYRDLGFEYRTKAREKYIKKKIEELKSDMDYEPDVVVYFMSNKI